MRQPLSRVQLRSTHRPPRLQTALQFGFKQQASQHVAPPLPSARGCQPREMVLLQWIPRTPPVTRQRVADTPGQGQQEGDNKMYFTDWCLKIHCEKIHSLATWSLLKGWMFTHDRVEDYEMISRQRNSRITLEKHLIWSKGSATSGITARPAGSDSQAFQDFPCLYQSGHCWALLALSKAKGQSKTHSEFRSQLARLFTD